MIKEIFEEQWKSNLQKEKRLTNEDKEGKRNEKEGK